MATKCIVLGETEHPEKGRPIEFKQRFSGKIENDGLDAISEPKDWQNIELLSASCGSSYYDLLFVYNENRSHGVVYAGHWNDGFVE